MKNHLEQLNTVNNLSLEPVKNFGKLLLKLHNNDSTTMNLFDLHMQLKKKMKFTPAFDLHNMRKLSWLPQPNLPIAKDNMGIAYAEGKIYTIGGRTSIGDNSLLQPEDSLVQVYDLNTKQWSTKQKMLYPHTGNVAITASNGKIYSFGGYLKLPDSISPEDYALYQIIFDAMDISSLVQEYNPSTNSWQRKENMPSARVFSAAATTEDGSIYIFGGYEPERVWPDPENPSGSSFKIINAHKTYRYDTGNNGWSYVADMPTPRSGPVAVRGKDGKIYVMGGLGNNCQWLSTVEVYDPKTNTWEKKVDMPTPRGAFSAVADSNGKIYVIGGVSIWDSIENVEIYDPLTESWQNGPEITPDRLSHGAIITEDDTIFIIGGSQQHPADDIALLLSSSKSWDVAS